MTAQQLPNQHPWKYTSSDELGWHCVVSPDSSMLRSTWLFRLNLAAGTSHEVSDARLELNGAVIAGRVKVHHQGASEELGKLDSFYLPAGDSVRVEALEESFLYFGGAVYEGVGSYFVRHYDAELPLGEIRQVHGKPPYERQVFMTTNQEVPGSRLICGITWGEEGQWTSWPPHQHTAHLEEIYCYFDIPAPKFAFHLGYTEPGQPVQAVPVSTGDCMLVPEGYHPTVGTPGVRSCYFWVMAAHTPESRRYDLAVNDPHYG
ncbi:MAG: myo-inositol catabolism protein [Planctomycetota bacterium]|nr:MAG: myo-inositol catabolism protein [Planctomycetota bacterium]